MFYILQYMPSIVMNSHIFTIHIKLNLALINANNEISVSSEYYQPFAVLKMSYYI